MTTAADSQPSRDGLRVALLAAGRALGNSASMLSHACAERLGLHATDWECINLLNEVLPEALTAGRLAELTGLSTGAVTGVIDRLEAGGFARRERDPADRRRVIVRVDEARMVETRPLFAGMIAEMLALQDRYSDEQLALFADLLDSVSDVLRRHALALRAESRGSGSPGIARR